MEIDDDEQQLPETFLEPVYLNEKMVLNCAAYLFKGYALDTETREVEQQERSRSAKAGIGFLQQLVSVGGEVGGKDGSTSESKSARRYTVGGLHMSLIDELRERGMLFATNPDDLAATLNGCRPGMAVKRAPGLRNVGCGCKFSLPLLSLS